MALDCFAALALTDEGCWRRVSLSL